MMLMLKGVTGEGKHWLELAANLRLIGNDAGTDVGDGPVRCGCHSQTHRQRAAGNDPFRQQRRELVVKRRSDQMLGRCQGLVGEGEAPSGEFQVEVAQYQMAGLKGAAVMAGAGPQAVAVLESGQAGKADFDAVELLEALLQQLVQFGAGIPCRTPRMGPEQRAVGRREGSERLQGQPLEQVAQPFGGWLGHGLHAFGQGAGQHPQGQLAAQAPPAPGGGFAPAASLVMVSCSNGAPVCRRTHYCSGGQRRAWATLVP